MATSPQPELTPMQRALLAVKKLEAQRDAAIGAMREPIAVVGMACRFPGGVRDPHSYWELLQRDADVIGEIPAARLPDLATDAPRHAGLLDDLEGFDREFFGLSAAEVERLDPQHRMLLEVAWHAFEDAGVNPNALEGSRTGTFIGLCASTVRDARDGAAPGVYDLTGSGACFAAGRLAYHFGLQGPCMVVDTACSSSLVSVDLACKSLRLGESDLALAGGVNLITSSSTMASLVATGALSPTGVCRPFDAGANGFVRAEGCGIVVLKRLRDALRDGDRVWATVAASHVNQDGRSNGLTAPNGAAQESLLREALRAAAVSADRIGYIEAHGTGTSLGDPIEIEALRAVYGGARANGSRCALGSVKSQLGHLEAAAGIAGLIKAALVLWHGVAPKQVHFSTLNPRVSLDGTCLEVPRAPRALNGEAGTRMAAVSSFGMSGTNAHVILGEVCQQPCEAPVPSARVPLLFTCSAHTAEALTTRLHDLTGWLDANQGIELGGLCQAAHQRAQLKHRAAIVVRDVAELRSRLSALACGEPAPGSERGRAERSAPKLAFLFSGQGSQYSGMARALYQHEPTFRAAIDGCAELLRAELSEPLLPLMFETSGGRSRLELTQFTQPALFTVQYAMAELLRSHGVQPTVLLGHSIGELVAACVAGVLDLPDALRLVAARGRLIAQHGLAGSMLAVRAAPEQLAAELAEAGPAVAIAAVNGPKEIVIAGADCSIELLEGLLRQRAIRTKRLSVSHPFHSPAMDPVLEPFARVAEQIRYRLPRIPLISSVDGGLDSRMDRAQYWVEQIRKPVLFHAALQTLVTFGSKVCLECGPKPTLLAIASRTLEQHAMIGVPTLRSGHSDPEQLAGALARLYVAGVAIDPVPAEARGSRVFCALPLYPFERRTAEVTPSWSAPEPLDLVRQPVEPAGRPNELAREPQAPDTRLVTPRKHQTDSARLLELIARGEPRLAGCVGRVVRLSCNASELVLEHDSLLGLTSHAAELPRLAQELAFAMACAWLGRELGSVYTAACGLSAGNAAGAAGRLLWRVRRWCAPAPGGETLDLRAFDADGRLVFELPAQRFAAHTRASAARSTRHTNVQLEAPRVRNVGALIAEAS